MVLKKTILDCYKLFMTSVCNHDNRQNPPHCAAHTVHQAHLNTINTHGFDGIHGH